MIDVYIRFYKDQDSGSKIEPIAAEKKILTLPTTMQLNGLPIQNPKVKVEMGKSESFDFTLTKNSPYYQGVFQNKTIFRVVYDGNTIFYGRAITIDTNWKNGNQTVHCEGPLSFLVDTYYKAVKETKRQKVSLNTYITDLLSNHRWYVGDHSRDIWPGEIPGGYSNAIESDQQISDVSEKFGVSSWTETKSALEDVRGYYGGYFRTRYSGENGAGYGYVYLDWLKDYFRDMTGPNVQKIEVAKNLIDYSARTEISNLFTAIVPVGKDGLTLGGYNGSNLSTEVWRDVNQDSNGTADWISVRAVYEMYHDALNQGYHNAEDYHTALNIYGWVYKTVSFPDAGTKSKLFTEAVNWLKNNYYPFVDTYTIKAIDMRMLGKADDAILVGDKRVFSYISSDGASGSATKPITLTVISAEYDLYNLENTSYKVGIPSELLTKMWNVKSGTKTTGNSTDPKNPPNSTPTESEDYDDWMTRITKFLLTHDVPGSDPSTNYYVPGELGILNRLYNPLTGEWDYIRELTYDEITSRSLSSWIILHDEPEDVAEWKRIIYGYNDDNKTPYLDMIRDTFLKTEVPNRDKTILVENSTTGEMELYKPSTDEWVRISEFSLSVIESYDLFDWYYKTFGVDLRDQEAVYAVEEEVTDPAGQNKKAVSLFAKMWNEVKEKVEPTKLFWYDMAKKILMFRNADDEDTPIEIITTFEPQWVNTKNQIGQIITKTYNVDGQGTITVDAGKLLLSVDPTTGKTLADIMADTVDVRATNKITLALNKTDAAFVLTKLEGMDANQKDTLASLIAGQIDVRAENKVSIGLNNTDAAFVLSKLNGMSDTQKGTLASLIADKISITANQIAQFGVAVGNEITAGMLVEKLSNGTTTTKIKSDYIDFSGYVSINDLANFGTEVTLNRMLHADGGISVGADGIEMMRNSNAFMSNVYADHLYMGSEDADLLNAVVASSVSNSAMVLTDTNGATVATFEVSGNNLYIKDQNNNTLTFSKAGSVTLTGAWEAGKTGKFTVSPTPSSAGNSVFTTLTQLTGTDYAHWGQASSGEDENTYYGTIGAAINGSSNVTAVFPFVVNALTRYNAGKTYATDNLSVVDNGNNKVDVTLDGTTVTTYSHNKYTLGQNSIRIAKNWSGGIATFTKSTASTLPTSQEVRLTSATTWNGNVATVAIWDGPAADAQQGGVPTGYTVTITVPELTYSWQTLSGATNTITVSQSTTGVTSVRQVLTIGVDSSESWSSGTRIVYLYSNPYGQSSQTKRARYGVSIPNIGEWGTPTFSSSENAYSVPFTICGKTFTGSVPLTAAAITASTPTAVTTTTGLTNLGTVAAVIDGTTKTIKYATTISSVKGFYLTVDGTDAYAAGWNAAVSGTSMPGSYSTSTTINVRLPSTTVDGELRTRQYVIGADATYAYLQYLRSSDSQYVTVCRVTHNQYNLGWHAAYDVNGLPSAYATNSYMTVTMPGSSPGNTITRRYYVGADSSYAYIQYLRESDSQYVTVARIANSGGGSGSTYNSGWTAAYNQITLPTTASVSNGYIDILTPNSTPGSYPPATSRYTLSSDAGYVYLKYGSVTVARAANNGYDDIYQAGFQEGFAMALDPSRSYWWYGEESSGYWGIYTPKAEDWRYAYNNTRGTVDWPTIGARWDAACYPISGGSGTHSVSVTSGWAVIGKTNPGADTFIGGCTRATDAVLSSGRFYKFQAKCGTSTKWYYIET